MPEISNKVSYSKICTYMECPELYRQKYIVKNRPSVVPLEEPLIKGTLTHACVESFLNGVDKAEAITLNLRPWLTEVCYIDIAEETGGSGVSIELLEEYAVKFGKLLYRCSESYTGVDKIRNSDGSVPKDPIGYMPKDLKIEYQEQGLDLLRFNIDNQAVQANRSFIRFSLADTAAVAISYFFIFELPEYVDSVKSVELDLQTCPVGFNDNRYYWNGILDSEYVTNTGAIILNDHKTEKNKRRPEEVAFDLQLNSYAFIRYEQTEHLPDYISITHLASNTLIAAETDSQIVDLSIDYLESVQKEIDHNIDTKPQKEPWLKRWPTKYGSPCLRRHWKTGNIEKACPYINNCWPEFYQCVKEEVDNYFSIKPVEDEPLDIEPW